MASIALLEPYERSTGHTDQPGIEPDLVSVLILGAQKKIDQALAAHFEGNFTAKGFYIGRATSIIDALRDALDLESEGAAGRDYDRVYASIDAHLQLAIEEPVSEPLSCAREGICRLSALRQAGLCDTSMIRGTS